MATPRRPDWPLLSAILSVIVCRVLALRTLPLYDDAFITLRYARNLAEGHGFVYQVGERVLGTTTPLFGLLLSVPIALHLPMPATLRLLEVACDVGTLVVTWRLLRDSAPAAARWVFAACFAFGPILNRIAAGGMEMDLYVLVSVLAVRLDQRGRRAGVGLAALGYFLRPESLLLVALLLVRTWRRAGLRTALGSAALAAAIVGLPTLGIQAYYGAPLSQSVTAKWHMVRTPLGRVVRELVAYEAFVIGLLPLTAWGLWRALRERGPVRVLALWMAIQVAAYVAVRPMMWSWYVEPMVYVEIVLAAWGGGDLLARWAKGRDTDALFRRAAVAAPALVALAWVAIGVRQGPSQLTRRLYVPLAAWCATHGGPNVTFMALDIGALGYYSRGRIYDQAGLTWPPGQAMTGEEIVRRYAPDYVFVDATRQGLTFMRTADFRARYRKVVRWAKSGETDLDPDPARAPTEWLADYILCERVGPAASR